MDRDLIGWVLVGAGGLDVATAFVVVGPRLPEEKRRLVVAVIAGSGGLMVSVGGCFLAHIF